MHRLRLRWPGAVTLVAVALLLAGTGSAAAQQIEFRSELPRTLVFITERGDAAVAAREVSSFLFEAGFPIIDPALAHTVAQRELVQKAIAGDAGAAVQLGRDFGAHVLLLGTADWGVVPNPADPRQMTGTADVSIRAIRLDGGALISTKRGESRTFAATEQAARAAAIRDAVAQVIERTELIGAVANNWDEQPWSPRDYFQPDPGSVGAALSAPVSAGAPRLAILRTDVLPAVSGDAATRNIGVVRRNRDSQATNEIDLEGIVVGQVAAVDVEGVRARTVALDADEARRLGVPGGAQRFTARLSLPQSRDTVRVTAQSVTGEIATAMAAPRIGRRWAVIVGVSDYRSSEIQNLRFASRDARAVYDFLRTSAAGPFEEENILFLENADATAQAIREALFVFLQQAEWNDLVVIYFAGHGAPDPNRPDNLYLLPVDADLNALASTAFPMWDVKTALRRQIRAERVIVIADACHSGGTSDGSANPISGAFAELFEPSRRLTLTAADTNELSYEDTRWGGGHGAFTYHLLEGLRGAADADGNGIVTFEEASAYVAQRVRSETNGRQNPQRSGLGDVPLAEVGAR
jgi:hypothetical protein